MPPFLIVLIALLLAVIFGGGGYTYRRYYGPPSNNAVEADRGAEGAVAVATLVFAVLMILFLIYGGFTFFHWFDRSLLGMPRA